EMGVTDATYLVVPRYHGGWSIESDALFAGWCRRPRPFTVRWCLHGYRHEEAGTADRLSVHDRLKRRFLTAGEGEVLNLPEVQMASRIDLGSRAFAACLGFEPAGFVAPAWLFNRALIPALSAKGFAWTEDLWRIYDLRRRTTIDAPVITWATRTLVRR